MMQRIQLVVHFGGFLRKPSGLIGVFLCQLRVALLQFCNFLALGFNDVVVLLPAGPAAIDGFGLHLQPVFTADCEQKITAQMIEGHLSVIGSAGLLRRVRQRDAQGFQRLFLLGFPFAVAVFDIEHLPGVDVGTGLVQMQRPVQHMDVGAEALFHRCKKRQHHVSQHLGRRAVALFSDLVDGFFRANARIPQQIVNGSIALGMTGFGVALVLPRNKRPVPALIFVPLVLGEGREAAVLVQRQDEESIEGLLKSDTIWYCGECMSCKTRCPRCNTPGGIIMALRRLSQEKGWFTESEKGRQQFALKRILGNNILNYGYCVTPDIVKPEMHPEQGPVWEWIYEHRDEVYERTHSNYKQTGAGALRKVDDDSLNELKQIFEVTGGSEFMENIETYSLQKAEEEGMDPESYFLHTYTDNNGRHGGR